MKDKQSKKQSSNQFNEEVGAEIMDFETSAQTSSNSKKDKKSKKNKKNR